MRGSRPAAGLAVLALLLLVATGWFLLSEGAGSAGAEGTRQVGPRGADLPQSEQWLGPERALSEVEQIALSRYLETHPSSVLCQSPVEQFLALVDGLRQRCDGPTTPGEPEFETIVGATIQVELPPVAEGDDEVDEFFSRLLASGFDPRRRNVHLVEFQRLKACAEESGDDEQLKIAAVGTFDEETRPLLKELWLSFLGHYNSCDPLVMETVRRNLRVTLDGAQPPLPSGFSRYRIRLMVFSRCEDVGPSLVLDFLAIGALLPDGPKKVQFYMDLAKSFPWNGVIEAQFLSDLQTDGRRWQAVELLYFYARQLGPAHVQSMLLHAPDVLDGLMTGEFGRTEAWATYHLLAEHGGAWGADTLLMAIEQAEFPEDRAEMIGFLSEPGASAVHWSVFQEYLGEEDSVSRAAWNAIAARAIDDDSAYEWLRLEASLGGEGLDQLKAIEAVGLSGREDVATFLLDEVAPGSSDASVLRAALSNAAFQPGADLDRVLAYTDYRSQPDALVRRTAAESVMLVKAGMGNIDEAFEVAESLIGDPDLGDYAAGLSGLYLKYGTGDEQSLARWEELKPAGFELVEWGARDEIADFLRPFSSERFSEVTADRGVLASLSAQNGHPLATRLAGQAALNEVLHTIARHFPQETSEN